MPSSGRSKRTLLSSGSAVPATHFTADFLLGEGEGRQAAAAAGKEHGTHKDARAERAGVSVCVCVPHVLTFVHI
jgi:hypothetical protein